MIHFYLKPNIQLLQKIETKQKALMWFLSEDKEDKIIQDFCTKLDTLLELAKKDNQLSYILFKVFE